MYPRLCIRKFLRFFRVKSSAAPRFAVFGFGYSPASRFCAPLYVIRTFTLVFSRLRPRRALPRIYIGAPAFIGCRSAVCRTAFIGCRSTVCRTAFIGCRAYVSALMYPKVFALFSGKVFCRTALCRFRVRLLARVALTPRALPLVFYGAPALPLHSRTEVGRTRLCGLPARLKVICYTFDRKNKFPTVLTAKDPPPSNLSGNL